MKRHGILFATFAFLLVALFVAPTSAEAAGGLGTFRVANCTDITAPVANQTWCFQQSDGQIYVWDGASWNTTAPGSVSIPLPHYTVAPGPNQFPPACTDYQLAEASDNIRGVWKCLANTWFSLTGHAAVEDFGVTTASSDNTAAYNTLLAALPSGGTIEFPQGTFIGNLNITATDYTVPNIVGQGMLTHLQGLSSNTNPVISVTGTSGSTAKSVWQNFYVDGVDNTRDCIDLVSAQRVTTFNVHTRNCKYGYYFHGSLTSDLFVPAIINNLVGIYADRYSSISPNNIHLYGGTVAGNSTFAIQADKITGWRSDGTEFSGNGTLGNAATGTIKITNGGYDASMYSYFDCEMCWFEGNTGEAEIDGTSYSAFARLLVNGGTFGSGGATGPYFSVIVRSGKARLTSFDAPCLSGCGTYTYALDTSAASAYIEDVTATNQNLGTSTSTWLTPTSVIGAAGFNTSFGTTVSTASATPVTIFTAATPSTYLVYGYLATGGASYQATATVACDNAGNCAVYNLGHGASMTITVSGSNVQLTQASGAPQVMDYSYTRLY